MELFLLGVLALSAGGACSLLLPVPWKTRALLFFSLSAFLLLLAPSFIVLFSNHPYVLALGALSLKIDALGAFFQMMIASLFFISILFLTGYLKRGDRGASRVKFLFLMTLFAVAFLLLTVVNNAIQFLIAWQALILAFGLAAGETEGGKDFFSRYRTVIVFEAGFLLLTAGMLFFALSTGGFGFTDLDRVCASPSLSIIVFILLTSGFALTAAWPLYAGKALGDPLFSLFSVFLVSAGAFGLFRSISWTGDPGGMFVIGTLLALSAFLSVWGAMTAVRKKDLGSFLSFSGTMNFGLTGLAAGLGMMGTYYGNTMMAVSGFSAALFQVVNHAIARSLVLFSAGKAAPGKIIPVDRPSGLERSGPGPAIFFFIGSLAMIGVPMFNGLMNFFLSSFGVASETGKDLLQTVLMVLSLTGTILPVIFLFSFFSKSYPLVWLSGKVKKPVGKIPGGPSMGAACVTLAVLAFATGIFPQYIAIFTVNPAADLANTIASYTDHGVQSAYSRVFNSLNMVSKTLLTFAGLAVILYLVRLFVLTKRDLEASFAKKMPARRSGR